MNQAFSEDIQTSLLSDGLEDRVRKRKEKEKKRITAVCVLSRLYDLDADMLKKIICLAGLL